MSRWQAFWQRILSPQTARFILSQQALLAAVGVTVYVMKGELHPTIENAMMFALGQLFSLVTIAFNYYFGSTARRDERERPGGDPLPEERP